MLPDEVRLTCLLERLRELDRREVPVQDRAIVEVGRAGLLQAIHELSHRLRRGDNGHLDGPSVGAWPHTERADAASDGPPASFWRQLHEEADIPTDEEDVA